MRPAAPRDGGPQALAALRQCLRAASAVDGVCRLAVMVMGWAERMETVAAAAGASVVGL